jgi:beta-galactosidase GanA
MCIHIIVCVGVLASAAAYAQPLPHLEKRGQATQLIVDGKPFLMLAGELNNTVSSDTESMRAVWPALARRGHLNTVLTAVAWNWIEPQEGKFDFRLVDDAIRSARQTDIRLVLLWFGSWKNGLSSFVPVWVKADQQRFPRAQVGKGRTVEVLSTLSESNRQADERAFAALMRHVRETDTKSA